jgi:hypothetical protein
MLQAKGLSRVDLVDQKKSEEVEKGEFWKQPDGLDYKPCLDFRCSNSGGIFLIKNNPIRSYQIYTESRDICVAYGEEIQHQFSH